MKIIRNSILVLAFYLLMITLLMAIDKPKPKTDRFGNDIEILKIKVIMGDTNVLTVEELIEVYHELNH